MNSNNDITGVDPPESKADQAICPTNLNQFTKNKSVKLVN